MTTVAQELRINEEYASLVPKISDSQYKEIKQDIQEHGQHVPIIINEKGEILDGLTRNRICQELEIEPRTMLCSPEYEDPLLAKQFIININRNRRHLDTFQRGELQYNLEPIEAELARRRQSEAGGDKKSDRSVQNYTKRSSEGKDESSWSSRELELSSPKGRVIDIAAKKAQISAMTYVKIRYLIKNESPEVLEKLRIGKLKIDKVYGRRVKQEKRQWLIEEAAKNRNNSLPKGFELILGDMKVECKQIPDNSIDCIFTDPPYNLESLPLYEHLASLAMRVLKPGGSLITMTGGYELLRVGNILEYAGLKFNWVCYMKHTGATLAMHGNHVVVCGKRLLWFFKGDKLTDTGKYVTDFVESKPPDKSLHDWAQSPVEAEHFINQLTVDNQIVLDPFMGSGCFGIAAMKLKRQFIGIEIDKDRFEIAKANLERASQSEKEVSA